MTPQFRLDFQNSSDAHAFFFHGCQMTRSKVKFVNLCSRVQIKFIDTRDVLTRLVNCFYCAGKYYEFKDVPRLLVL